MRSSIRLRGKKVPWIWLALTFAMLCPVLASAAWLRASGDHFIVYSNTSERQLRDFTSQLERYDKGLRRLYLLSAPEDEGSRSNRLIIFAVNDVVDVRRLCGKGCSYVAGFYNPRAGGSVVFTPIHSGDRSANDLDAQVILFHEYAHHFMYTTATAAYPAWFSEGFAEFAATARPEKDGGFSFGLPAFHRAYNLKNGMVLSTEGLLGNDVRRRADPEALYARGWLLTHYLFFSSERSGQLKNISPRSTPARRVSRRARRPSAT